MDVTTAAAIKPAIAIKPGPVRINGVDISREAIAREAQNHPADNPREAWRAAARALAIRELLLQRARAIGLTPAPASDGDGRRETDDEALVRAVIDQEVIVPTADEASCARYYEHNAKRFRSPDLFAVSHILLAAAPGDRGMRDAARTLAQTLITELEQAPERFKQCAQEHSACSSRAIGGALGQIGPGQTVPEFEKALLHIPAGTMAHDPIETRYGLHIVRVDHREPGRQLPFAMVRGRIQNYLDTRVRHAALRQYISMLAGASQIAGVDLELATSPLVQ